MALNALATGDSLPLAHLALGMANWAEEFGKGHEYPTQVFNTNTISLGFGGKNNIRLDDGFYPGSGFQEAADATSAAIRGRFQNGSDELTKLKAQTTGTAVITLTYDANNSLAVTFQKVGFSVVDVGDTDGRVTRPEARTSERRPFPGNSADFPLHFYMSRRKLFVEVAG